MCTILLASRLLQIMTQRIVCPFLSDNDNHLNLSKAPTKLISIEDDDFFLGRLYQLMMQLFQPKIINYNYLKGYHYDQHKQKTHWAAHE
jgi:hypothetical protein